MLKLPRLPDRTPVRLTVTLDAPLNAALKTVRLLVRGYLWGRRRACPT